MKVKELILPPLLTLAISLVTWALTTVHSTASKVSTLETWQGEHVEYSHAVGKSLTTIDKKLDCIIYIDAEQQSTLNNCLQSAKE